MNDQHITYFKVENFKRFKSFEMENVGQFNLLVGDNNVGKTTVLESLLIEKEGYRFFEGLRYLLFTVKKFNRLSSKNLLDIYLNTPETDKPSLLDYTVQQKNGTSTQFSLRKKNGGSDYEWVVNGTTADTLTNLRYDRGDDGQTQLILDIPYIPFGFSYDHRLTNYYSNYIQLSNSRKDYFIKGLKNIIPKIKNIEVNAGFSSDPVLLISEEGNDAVLPLATFGDGVLKLFRLLIAIVVHRSKRLMIDEVETGIHYSRMKEFWKVVLSAAKDNDVQLFCTTHSRECMESYSIALDELGFSDDGRIIRLAETTKGVKAYTMAFDEFEKAILADSEIR